ncbi:peptidase C14 [Colletotrichum phormii]|uniref:Protein SERAC1 n=1 Tax=Colletotrichum phormii TaxID=359342 RepID=A0AAI9ZSG5_9PEZI|nr:peptidase C14 [Colletotrichum phormii]KAK1637273.1 peptidase C14 [Colletotrichum phormii]
MTSFTYGTSSLWAVGIATIAALLLTAYPFIVRLQPDRRNARADGLDIIYDPSENKPTGNLQFEIVAVHGLGAHPDHTWEGKKDQAKVHLLRNLLPEAFPTARILSFSYNSDWLVDAPEKTAQQVGYRLAEILAKHRAGALRLPIIFIGHSFGGIVIKEALCASYSSPNTLADTCGIIFLGTPHQGSSLSAAGALLSKLTGFLGSNTALLLSLRGNHNRLSDLEDRFRYVLSNEKIASFYETKPTYYLGLAVGCIVDRESARGFSRSPVGIDTNHSGLNKFSHPKDPGFQVLKAAIEEFRAKPLIKQADDFLFEKHYNSEKLKIQRLSGEELLMDQCYINLSIVEQVQKKTPSQDELETKASAPRSSPFSLLARLKVETSAEHSQVQLKDIFSQRKRSDGIEISPRRILIRGRAGVGKTTLCKKMVHDFVRSGMWRDLFDRVLWVPLRNLKERPAPGYNLESLFFDEFFRPRGNRSGELFAEETRKALKDDRTLFILDGWDEVDRIANAGSNMSCFLRELLHQPNIIITSRPSASVPIPDQQPIHLELETIGFNPTQVDEYIEVTHVKTDTRKVDEIKTFLQSHELIRSLVRIPIQLDALCYCWNDFKGNRGNSPETITTLYEAIQTSLWKKDIWRLEKKHEGERIEAIDLKNAGQLSVERHVKAEASFLEHLAFAGLVADKLEFESEYRDMINEYATSSSSDLMLDKTLPCLSFLRSSDPSVQPIHQSYHFIHLTFQEYFAARHFVQHWNHRQPFKQHLSGQQSGRDITPVEFFKRHKYDTQYNVMWRFVAGLLDKEKNASNFFEEIEKEPIDLLGPTHQRLIMYCLNEALELPTGLRDQRGKRLLQWVLFERDFTGSSTFISEPEIPEQVLNSALSASGDKTRFLDALRRSQRYLSDSTLSNTTTAALIGLLKDEDSNVRYFAAKALGNQSTLSNTTIAALIGLLKDEDSNVRSSVARALGKQSTLSDSILDAIGIPIQVKAQTNSGIPIFRRSRDIELLYESLLQRSFNEHFSLYIDRDIFILNQAPGLRMATLEDQSLFQMAVKQGRKHLEKSNFYSLWSKPDEQDSR